MDLAQQTTYTLYTMTKPAERGSQNDVDKIDLRKTQKINLLRVQLSFFLTYLRLCCW